MKELRLEIEELEERIAPGGLSVELLGYKVTAGDGEGATLTKDGYELFHPGKPGGR